MATPPRRRFLRQGAALAVSSLLADRLRAAEPAQAGGGRAVVIGGGWGGLAAARHLRALAPQIEVTLIEREAVFRSLPLSTKWLAGLLPEQRLLRDYGTAGRRWGWQWRQATVTAIDRERRVVRMGADALPYDWLILASGIGYDWSAWFGDDAAAARQAARDYPCAFRAAELPALRSKLDAFGGGDLLMNLPANPARCPPAGYERAVMIASRFKQRGTKARLVLVDPGAGILGFRQLFEDRYRAQVLHITHANVKSVDLANKVLRTEFDDIRFDDAILAPPQQASELVWQAGLVGRGGDGRATGWAAQDPLRLHAVEDERVYLVGDLIGQVSPLFGQYSKSAHVAARLGRIAATEIAARAAGRLAPVALPDSICYVNTDYTPLESVRIDAEYRQRGDGVITQNVRQSRDPQPRGEDEAWAGHLLVELFGTD